MNKLATRGVLTCKVTEGVERAAWQLGAEGLGMLCAHLLLGRHQLETQEQKAQRGVGHMLLSQRVSHMCSSC
jgi:hypothetical protein